MKIEIGAQKPDHFQTYWDGQYELFSHLEYACGIPSLLFAVTTMKENGKANVCFSGWSSFTGDGEGYFAVVGGVGKSTHTHRNILRTGEFVINFISKDYYHACIATINHNEEETDEMAAGGFTAEQAQTVACPRLREAFLCLECKFEKETDLSGRSSLLIGRVHHIALEEKFSTGIDGKYGEDGFMFNIHAPKNLTTGEGKASALAVCQVARINEEG